MADGVQVYIDGKPAKYKVEQDNLYRPFHNAGKPFNEPFRIGGGGGPQRRFRGRIDDVRVYGRLLNGQEIEALALGESINDIAAKPKAQRSEIEKVEIFWPVTGQTQTLTGLALDHFYKVREGDPNASPWPLKPFAFQRMKGQHHHHEEPMKPKT